MKTDPSREVLSKLRVRGYKSLRDCEVSLHRVNVLIGANGAGKSNLISLFGLIKGLLNQRLQLTMGLAGGPELVLHFGPKNTQVLGLELVFGDISYSVELVPTQDNRMIFSHETVACFDGNAVSSQGYLESQAHLYADGGHQNQLDGPLAAMRTWRVYHFHDASPSARIKQILNVNDNEYLREDGSNLAAFLYRLSIQHPDHLSAITQTIQLVAPYFSGFHLRPTVANAEKIQLEWLEVGHDEPFVASVLSDGTLRFICLATALLQPAEFMPRLMLIDEPELGLHPFAVHVLASLIKAVSSECQVIVATQSVELVNEFSPEDLIVVDKRAGASNLQRLDGACWAAWLEDYSLGELWQKNLLSGGPGR